MNKKTIGTAVFLICLAGAVIGANIFNTARKKKSAPEYAPKGTEEVVITIDEYAGFNDLLAANGGLVTKEGSINAEKGIKVRYVVENDAEKSSGMLIDGESAGAAYTVNRLPLLQKKFEKNGVKVIAPFITNFSSGGDGIIAKKEINSIEDLKGKRIAVPEGSEAQTLLEWLLKTSSLTEEERADIKSKMIPVKTADEAAELFFAGKADAAATWEPHLTDATTSTDARILFDTSIAPELIMDTLIFREDFAESHEEFLVNLIDGALQAKEIYLSDFSGLKELPAFALSSDQDIYEMCRFAPVATYADNMSVLKTTGISVYREMAGIWKSLGKEADHEKAEEIFTERYVAKLAGKYPEDDFTSFKFTEEGRKTAKLTENDQALLKMTLNIEFEPDSSKIKVSSSAEDLQRFADAAQLLSGTYIRIEGHTARVEGMDGEQLSKQRAYSVARYLQALGVNPKRFDIVWYSDKDPVAKNDTEEGKQQNRRVNVYFKTGL